MSDNRYYVNPCRPGTSASPVFNAFDLLPLRYYGFQMSAVEDMRKVLQDFLAPELRSVHARLDAMDEKLEVHAKVTEARFQEVLVRIDATNGRIDNLKTSIETRIDSTNQRIDVTNDRIDNLKTSLDLDKRVERLETGQSHRSA